MSHLERHVGQEVWIPLVRSPLLELPGVVHGFTTRAGGVSDGPFASLNLGRTFGGGDQVDRIAANLGRVREHFCVPTLLSVHQVHGDTVLEAADVHAGSEADGIVVRTPGQAALMTVADCAPVLIARCDGSAVAAVHAGWRGAVARIASRAVHALGTTDVLAAIGPCIGPCCFEVGDDVVDAARAVAGEGVILPGKGGRPHVDLAGIVVADLRRAGVPADRIDVIRRCCVCEPQAFYSHRRDHGLTGRQAGVIGLIQPVEISRG